MSKAKPMSMFARQVSYTNSFLDRPLTPRQRRRCVHKANRNDPRRAMAWQDYAKNYATPRRAAARAAMLERRRA